MRIKITLVLFMTFTIISFSQEKIIYKTSHKKAFLKRAKEKKIINAEKFYKHKININKIEEFKKEGIDIIELSVTAKDHFAKTLYASTIIQGTVIKRRYHPGEDNYFHTTYTIRVDDVIRGKVNSGSIEFKTVSGLIDPEKGIYTYVSYEPRLFMGEQSLFMLDKIYFDELNEAAISTQGIKGKKINADENQYQIYFKYRLKNGDFYDENKIKVGRKEFVKSKIEKISSINDIKQFNKIRF